MELDDEMVERGAVLIAWLTERHLADTPEESWLKWADGDRKNFRDIARAVLNAAFSGKEG